ncbi:MAG: 3'-phosphoesterase [Nanoarchaeota archaeon]|nr:3'-phosphoesterase [Nanoarchaeota archaeon]
MPRFVIHEHHASHLHWDLRLEVEGVLKSWAIPKDPTKVQTEHEKRLAIQVEDHKLSYIDFEGEIPEGHYGAGKVEIWDNGEFDILNYEDNKKIEFELQGKKMRGKFVLVKTDYGINPEKNWLWMKVKN